MDLKFWTENKDVAQQCMQDCWAQLKFVVLFFKKRLVSWDSLAFQRPATSHT